MIMRSVLGGVAGRWAVGLLSLVAGLIVFERPVDAGSNGRMLTVMLPGEGDPNTLSYQEWVTPRFLAHPAQPAAEPANAPIPSLSQAAEVGLDGFLDVSSTAGIAALSTRLQLEPRAASYATAVGGVVQRLKDGGKTVDFVTVGLNPRARHEIGARAMRDFGHGLIDATRKPVLLESSSSSWMLRALEARNGRLLMGNGEILLTLLADPVDILVTSAGRHVHLSDSPLIAFESALLCVARASGVGDLFDLAREPGRAGEANGLAASAASSLGKLAARVAGMLPGEQPVKLLVGGRPFTGDHGVPPGERGRMDQGCGSFRSAFLAALHNERPVRLAGEPAFLPIFSAGSRAPRSRSQLTHQGLEQAGRSGFAECRATVSERHALREAVERSGALERNQGRRKRQ